MTKEDLLSLTRLIEQYLPLGNDRSLCHVGICAAHRCERCSAALKAREILRREEHRDHDTLFSVVTKNKTVTVYGDNDSIKELEKMLIKHG